MAREKPIPRSQRKAINRGTLRSRNDDSVKNISVGLMDIDATIMYYFNNVIKPTVEENGETIKVPLMYSNPERWSMAQKRGYLLDNKKQLIIPLIAFKRASIEKDTTLPVDKLDPKVERIGVFVNESYENIISLIDDGIIHAAQLHGKDNSFCEKFLDKYKVIRAVGIKDDESVANATQIVVKTVLLDTFCGNDFGGSGHTFEWNYAKEFKSKNPERPLILAGGLNISNITTAINEVTPSAVDVASGVENESGFKDPLLVEKFINSVKG